MRSSSVHRLSASFALAVSAIVAVSTASLAGSGHDSDEDTESGYGSDSSSSGCRSFHDSDNDTESGYGSDSSSSSSSFSGCRSFHDSEDGLDWVTVSGGEGMRGLGPDAHRGYPRGPERSGHDSDYDSDSGYDSDSDTDFEDREGHAASHTASSPKAPCRACPDPELPWHKRRPKAHYLSYDELLQMDTEATWYTEPGAPSCMHPVMPGADGLITYSALLRRANERNAYLLDSADWGSSDADEPGCSPDTEDDSADVETENRYCKSAPPKSTLRQRLDTLASVRAGYRCPKPSSRLGAFQSTRKFQPGTVGHGAHHAIAGIYLLLGDVGQEEIGSVFWSKEAQRLLAEPIDSTANDEMAQMEYDYWEGRRQADPESVGGRLGAAFAPFSRKLFQLGFDRVRLAELLEAAANMTREGVSDEVSEALDAAIAQSGEAAFPTQEEVEQYGQHGGRG